jgi:hypothetical protein
MALSVGRGRRSAANRSHPSPSRVPPSTGRRHSRGVREPERRLRRHNSVRERHDVPGGTADVIAKGQLSAVAHLEQAGAVARVISWCTAEPVTQPQSRCSVASGNQIDLW